MSGSFVLIRLFCSDPNAFAEYFDDGGEEIAVFANLSKDAILVAPHPVADPAAYGHLAAFVRLGPETQRQSFWRAVRATLGHRVGVKPVWLNTAGAGVSWLHVRLDDWPKYYRFKPYI